MIMRQRCAALCGGYIARPRVLVTVVGKFRDPNSSLRGYSLVDDMMLIKEIFRNRLFINPFLSYVG